MSRREPALEVLSSEPPAPTGKPPLLFVPGLGHEARCWDNWRAAAADAGYPAHAMSVRGHGNSEGNVRRSVLSQYRDDVIRVAGTLPEPPVLVGHSLGGLMVAQAMSRHEVRGVVLVATVPARPALGSLLAVARQHPLDAAGVLAGRSLALRHEYMFEHLPAAAAEEHVQRCGPESPWAQFQLLLHRRPAPPRAGTPVLVLGARRDRLVPIADVRATARRYDAELVEFDDIGHNLMQDVGWEKTWAALREWLDRHTDPADDSPRDATGSARTGRTT